LIQGGQGVGKSIIGQFMERIIGESAVTRPTMDELHNRFTGWALGSQLVIIEELMGSGRRELSNRLKPLITEPAMRIELKGKDPFRIPNRMNFLLFTNHPDALPIDHDDRRFLVVFSPRTEAERDQKKEEGYYKFLFEKLNGKGPAELFGFLLNREIELNLKDAPPRTSGHTEMKRESLMPVETFLLDLFEHRQPPLHGSLIAERDLMSALPQDLRRGWVQTHIRKFLKNILQAQNMGQHQYGTGPTRYRPRITLWSIRNHMENQHMNAKARYSRYMKEQNQNQIDFASEDELWQEEKKGDDGDKPSSPESAGTDKVVPLHPKGKKEVNAGIQDD
jgi:hypothetical protein